MIENLPDENDDSEFIRIVEKILNGYIRSLSPDEIYIVKIDTWFDFKWRDFVGKFSGAVGFWNKSELRIPPFVPDRVLEELFFEKHGNAYKQQEARGLHIYQSSGNNITGKRKLVAFSETRLFIWFSGNTKNTLRGSLMIYQIEKENSSTLYISFLKKQNWQIYKTDGISRQEVLSMI